MITDDSRVINWRKAVARLAVLAVLGSTAAACESVVAVRGAVGVTVNGSGGLVFVAVWCDGPPDVLQISQTPFHEGDLDVAYEVKDLPKAGSTTLDISAPEPWQLTRGEPTFAGDVTYSAGMGRLGERSDVTEVVFSPDDVRSRVTPGRVLVGDNEIRPVADFTRETCRRSPG